MDAKGERWDSLSAQANLFLRDGTRLLPVARELIECDPDREYGYRMAAEAHRLLGDHRRAVELGSEALARAPESDFVHYRLAAFHRLAGSLDKAQEHVREAIQRNPQYAVYWVEQGWIAWQEDDHDGALRSAGRALELDPEHVHAMRLRALAMPRDTKAQLRDVMSLLDAALAVDPEDDSVWADKAQVHLRLKDWEQAEECARTALELDPTDRHHRKLLYDALKHRSWVYRTLRAPGGLAWAVFQWIAKLSMGWWLLLWIVGIGGRLLIAVAVLWLLWATFVWPVQKLYEALATAEYRRRAHEIAPRRRRVWDARTWPVLARIPLFLVLAGGFWYGAWRVLGTETGRDVLLASLAVGILGVVVLGCYLILRDRRRASRRRRAKAKILQEAGAGR